MTTPADAPARERIRDDLATTLLVEAAAGTGKTTALVGRIVSVLRSGVGRLDRLVAVTFTEKAAGEMKLRLRAEIETARASALPVTEDRARLDAALEMLEVARIGTIHGFCGDLLRERPVEAGVDPQFEVAPPDVSNRLMDAAFERWFQKILSDPPDGVRRLLRRRPRGFNAVGPREQLRNAAGQLAEHRDFDAAWTRVEFDREGSIDAALESLQAVARLFDEANNKDDWLAKNLAILADYVEENRLREAVRGRDYDALESELRDLLRTRRNGWHWKGRGAFSPDLSRAEVIEQRDAVKTQLETLIADADADLAPLLREELRPVIAGYEQAKHDAGVLDFLDLLLRARDLVRDHRDVRLKLQERFSHFFVDEFQDTDPLQADLVLLLASDDPEIADPREVTPLPGKLFLVGDPKQAIYRFRRADVATYRAVQEQLVARGAETIHLTTSFRALPSIQQAVNAAFEPRMGAGSDVGQASYVPLHPSRSEVVGQPSIVALPAPKPYGDYGRIVHWRIDESLPDAVGAFVDWLVRSSGWTVGEGERREPVAARHVCLLFRRFKSFQEDVTRPYVRALEARQVPHVLVGGRSFHDREEVLALRNALCAIEWPDDDLRVFATLRGPFFALGDDALLAFRHRDPNRVTSLNPLQPLDRDSLEGTNREVADALAILGKLHRRRNRAPIAETVSRLLDAVRAHAGIAIWPTGEQALANCLRVVDLARRFEARGALSFRAFVEHLELGAERGDAEEAPVVEEGTEGVRIMTAHRAKGLEFPVVILADPNCRASREPPMRYVDPTRRLWAEPLCGCAPRDLLDHGETEAGRDRAEAVRLAYVAATRARDLLVVPVVGDPFERDNEGWIDVLDPVVHPEKSARREPGPAPGCPPFGTDSVVSRPPGTRAGPRSSVAPGLHVPRTGPHGVVWWDPSVLDLDAREEVGLRQQRILEADEAGVASERGEREHAKWQAARTGRLEHGARPSLVVRSVTQRAQAASDEFSQTVEHAEVAGAETARPGGRRFGTLVHATLAVVDLAADAGSVSAAARSQGRLLGCPDDEVEAATRVVVAALEHPLMRRAAAAEQLRRETPVLVTLEDGSLAEGVVDLAFREPNDAGWTVVDFKTDRDRGASSESYDAQVRLYAEAIRRSTGENVAGALLFV